MEEEVPTKGWLLTFSSSYNHTKIADVLNLLLLGGGLKRPKLCWRNIWMMTFLKVAFFQKVRCIFQISKISSSGQFFGIFLFEKGAFGDGCFWKWMKWKKGKKKWERNGGMKVQQGFLFEIWRFKKKESHFLKKSHP